MSELIRQARLRDGDALDITSLAEGQRAHLIARGWDAIGYWRWVPTRSGRRARSFYTYTATGIATRVYGYDLPHAFKPLSPLQRGAPYPAPSVADPEPADMQTELTGFESRLLLAIRVDEAETDPDRKLLRVKTTNYQTSAAPGDYPTGITTRFRPTREQRADADRLLPLIAGLAGKPATALRLKALGFATRSIAERMHTNAAKVRTHVTRAVTDCWRRADARQRQAPGRGEIGARRHKAAVA